MTKIEAGTAAIRAFWFDEIGPARWWVRSDETDAAIVARFGDPWEAWQRRPAADFLGSAQTALGAILLFDQFPRNMFRHQARAFSTDALALAIADGALAQGFDAGLDPDARSFLYMPFMHSEALADQDRAVALFEALGIENNRHFALLHRDMIARYGRFPARNAALGRPDLPGEAAGIAESRDW